MNFSGALRMELSQRATEYGSAHGFRHAIGYRHTPVVCFAPESGRHGNFLDASYKAILGNPEWRRRLKKVHTMGRHSFPSGEHGRWMELDACTSSDALLMNIFCHPRVTRMGHLLVSASENSPPRFGFRARVPLSNGFSDRTEVDMRLNDVLVEAKLTESDFQKAAKHVLAGYRDFAEVFEAESLPQTESHYLSYQLLRNVMAAYALSCSFCVITDARRPDLIEAWYAVMRCVKPVQLRTRLRVLTWQELVRDVGQSLQTFLAHKYGIEAVM